MLLYCSYRISRARETSGYWCSIGNIKRKELLLYWLSTEQSIVICCSLEYIQSIQEKCLLLLCCIECVAGNFKTGAIIRASFNVYNAIWQFWFQTNFDFSAWAYPKMPLSRKNLNKFSKISTETQVNFWFSFSFWSWCYPILEHFLKDW
jgi:hypothetical protein